MYSLVSVRNTFLIEVTSRKCVCSKHKRLPVDNHLISSCLWEHSLLELFSVNILSHTDWYVRLCIYYWSLLNDMPLKQFSIIYDGLLYGTCKREINKYVSIIVFFFSRDRYTGPRFLCQLSKIVL